MKIAFYLNDSGLPSLNFSKPYEGNPGIGGTHYCIILLIYYINKFKPEYELTVYCYQDSSFPEGVSRRKIKDFPQLMSFSVVDNQDLLLMKHESDINKLFVIKNSNQKVIFWGHNYYYSNLADSIFKNENIVANVFVGKQQYDRYLDHPVIDKSTVVFNMITNPVKSKVRINDSKTVVYMGALIPTKGFLQLAKLWKYILKHIPDAKLKVIGTGQVYSRDIKMGKFGIAEESFENQFMPFLTDNFGKIHESVQFLGLLDEDKYNVFLNASVGVINPSARTEIFSMSIMEMAAAELPVVTLNYNGFPDSIENEKTGYLCSTQKEIANKIILLLKNKELNQKMGQNAKIRLEKFAPEIITPLWISLFEQLRNKNFNFPVSKASPPFLNNSKWLRIVNRYLRSNLRIKFFPPIITIETFANNFKKRFF